MKLAISTFLIMLTLLSEAQSEFTRVKDIFPSGSSDPTGFVVINGRLLCVADDGIHGRELFEIDSLGSDCNLFKDINPYAGSTPFGFVYFDNKYWFGANDGVYGTELWTTDGSADGTQRFMDTVSPGDMCYGELVLADNKLFFARNGPNGSELWVTFGSHEETMLVKNIGPEMIDSPSGILALDGKIYFIAYDNYWGLWVSDGTETGTRLIKRTCPIFQYGCSVSNVQVCGRKVYFQVFDFNLGAELWALDTETDSVFLVKDINPTGSSDPYSLTVFNDRLYFSADDGVHDSELWTTDGTLEGTYMVKDINPSGLSFPNTFTIYKGRMYFSAQDGVHGWELWSSDGTEIGTIMVKDCNPSGNFYLDSFVAFQDKLYFRGSDDTGKAMWVTDGTQEGTRKVEPPIQYNANPLLTYPHWMEYNNALYMGAEYDSAGKELWKLTSNSTAIPDYELRAFSIYPNPAHNTIMIQGLSNKFELTIFDITGKPIISQKTDNMECIIDIQKFNAGFYFISINQSGKLKKMKFIKQ